MDIIVSAEVTPADNGSAVVDGRSTFQRPPGTGWQKILQILISEVILPYKCAVVADRAHNLATGSTYLWASECLISHSFLLASLASSSGFRYRPRLDFRTAGSTEQLTVNRLRFKWLT